MMLGELGWDGGIEVMRIIRSVRSKGKERSSRSVTMALVTEYVGDVGVAGRESCSDEEGDDEDDDDDDTMLLWQLLEDGGREEEALWGPITCGKAC